MEEKEILIKEVKDEKKYTDKDLKRLRVKFKYLFVLMTVIIVLFSLISGFLVYFITKTLNNNNVLRDEDFQKYIDVLTLYNKYGITDLDMKAAVDLGIQSLVYNSNDKYGMYVPSEGKIATSDRITTGNYTGLGIVYEYSENKTLIIKEVVKNSPANNAGVKVNDIVTHINSDVINDDVLMTFVNELKNGSLKEVDFCVNGKNIHITVGLVEEPKIEYSIEDNIGIIKIYTFVPETVGLFKEAINSFKNKDLSKIIFDVRDNGGGDLSTVVEMLDYITGESELIRLETTTSDVSLKSISGVKENKIYSDENNELSTDLEVVVLVNSKTASASEFFTMTLQDTRDATVVGEQTYGKSTVLSYFTFKDGSLLAMSTGSYYPISERYIEGIGLPPDILLNDENLNLSVLELLNKGLI